MPIYKHRRAYVACLQCALFLFMVSACKTGADLQKRKYRRGYYFSKSKTVRVKEHDQPLVMQPRLELPGALALIEQQAPFPKAVAPDVVTASVHEPAPERNPHRRVNTPGFYPKGFKQMVYNNNTGSEKRVRRHVYVKTREHEMNGLETVFIVGLILFLSLLTLLVVFIVSGNGAGIVVICGFFLIFFVILSNFGKSP